MSVMYRTISFVCVYVWGGGGWGLCYIFSKARVWSVYLVFEMKMLPSPGNALLYYEIILALLCATRKR